jgi:hypothetical protein
MFDKRIPYNPKYNATQYFSNKKNQKIYFFVGGGQNRMLQDPVLTIL